MTSHRSRGFILVLVLLTLLGHVCELPLGTATADARPHTGHDDSPDHHDDENAISCDAVLGVPRSTHVAADLGLHVYTPSRLLPPIVASRIAAPALRESDPRPRELPLFLLHAALLI